MTQTKSIQIGSYTFSPRLLPTLVAIAVFYGLIQLGLWQLRRAEFKQQRLDRFAERGEGGTLSFSELLSMKSDWSDFPISTAGTYDVEHIILLDNRTHDTHAGYQVLVPLLPQDQTTWVLVNLGWVIGNPDRAILPDIPLPRTPIEVQGWADEPNPHYFTLAKQDYTQQNWPFVIQKIELDKLSGVLQRTLAPFVIHLRPDESAYVREWQFNPMPPERHRGYAFQWFALAATLLVIYFVITVKKRPREHT
jgi:surfeit locus 1 family protein